MARHRRSISPGLVAVVLAALVVSAAVQPGSAASARQPVAKMIWGPETLPNGQSAFPLYQQLGVNVFQLELLWAEVAPTRPAHPRNPADPAYHWPAEIDQALAAAKLDHITICLLVQQTPRWANGGRSPIWVPHKAADYGNFLAAAAKRYPSVHFWMVWGEPNNIQNFRPLPANSPVGPRHYALLLAAGYHALKRASRANIVIGGDTCSFCAVYPANYLKWMRLPNGKPPPLDYYGHNAFGRRFPRLADGVYSPGGRDLNDIDTLEAQLRHTYHRQVKLWLSEWTEASGPNSVFGFYLSPQQQANWLTAAFRLVNSVNYVAGFGWYTLLDEYQGTRRQQTFGLMTADLQPKPAFYAYQQAR